MIPGVPCGLPWRMRWDRLFADLEAEADEVARSETDALATDLRDEIWAETSWRDLLGGHVVLEVRGAGQVAGEVAAVNDRLVRLRSGLVDHLVACAAVTSVLAAERRADPPGRLDAALGWGRALRRLRDDASSVRLVLDDGRTVDGVVEAAGSDFARIGAGGTTRMVVLDAISVITSSG